jgi:hypothetical protein
MELLSLPIAKFQGKTIMFTIQVDIEETILFKEDYYSEAWQENQVHLKVKDGYILFMSVCVGYINLGDLLNAQVDMFNHHTDEIGLERTFSRFNIILQDKKVYFEEGDLCDYIEDFGDIEEQKAFIRESLKQKDFYNEVFNRFIDDFYDEQEKIFYHKIRKWLEDGITFAN